MSVNIVQKNISESNDSVICHQIDCVSAGTNYGAGVYSDIVNKYPEADVYKNRTVSNKKKNRVDRNSPDYDAPGGIHIIEIPDSPAIIAMLAQDGVKKSAQNDYSHLETHADREGWFKHCLALVAEYMLERDFKTVAFPFNIGCDENIGGIWDHYYKMLKDFSNQGFTVNIYKTGSSWGDC
jgi:hypothetical protein